MESAAAVNSIEDWFLRQFLEKAIESSRGSWESFSITTIELQEGAGVRRGLISSHNGEAGDGRSSGVAQLGGGWPQPIRCFIYVTPKSDGVSEAPEHRETNCPRNDRARRAQESTDCTVLH